MEEPDKSLMEQKLSAPIASGQVCAAPTIESWPDPVEGSNLLDDVAGTYRKYLLLPAGAADALALMVAHFHSCIAFEHSPRLSFQAVEKGCGKTTALEITARLSPAPLVAENMTAAVLIRAAGMRGVTLLLDEVDAWLLGNEAMRGILNAGHRRGGQVCRCDEPGRSIRAYKVFAPVVLAGIGSLPDTLQDRSVVIRLTRAKPGEIQARYDSRRTAAEEQLRAKLARWTKDNLSRLEICDPVLPGDAQNRLADNWRPLFSVAEVAGRDWPLRAADAYRKLNSTGSAKEEGIRIELLRDVRAIFNTVRAKKLASAVLVHELVKLEGQPWAEFEGRRAISTHKVAYLLHGFGINPRTIRFGGSTAKGYDRADFEDIFERFLPQTMMPQL
jgi:hypothetical protein